MHDAELTAVDIPHFHFRVVQTGETFEKVFGNIFYFGFLVLEFIDPAHGKFSDYFLYFQYFLYEKVYGSKQKQAKLAK